MISILLNLFLAIEIDEQNHEDRELIFEVLQKALEKKLVMLEKVMIQTMKLVMYKYLSVNLKMKNKITRRRNKKIKTSIEKLNHSIKSKCLK